LICVSYLNSVVEYKAYSAGHSKSRIDIVNKYRSAHTNDVGRVEIEKSLSRMFDHRSV